MTHAGPTKASRAKASKQTGKSATKQARVPRQSRALAAAAPESHRPELKPSALDGPPSLAERLQAERKQIFKAISIVECCKNATATLLEVNDSEYMIPAFEAVCDLLDTSATELGRIVDECAGRGRPQGHRVE
jgi:capsular polysaccharide biosynthesis protein